MKRPQESKATGWVYLIHATGTSFYKIGISLHSVEQRVKELQTGSPHQLYIVDTCLTSYYQAIEKILHQIFSRYRYTGEWFKFDDLELIEIVRDIFTLPDTAISVYYHAEMGDISIRDIPLDRVRDTIQFSARKKIEAMQGSPCGTCDRITTDGGCADCGISLCEACSYTGCGQCRHFATLMY